jgi:hypothetical protein
MVAVHGKKPEVRLNVHNVTVLMLSNENFMQGQLFQGS